MTRKDFLEKKRARKYFKLQVIFFLGILLIGVIVYVTHLSVFRISHVELSGNTVITQEEIEKNTQEFLSGSYFWLFPKNNIVWYPKSKLEEGLKENFKRIETINIHLKGTQTLSIDITERKGVSLWCSEGEKCYFMDTQSFIFADAPEFSGDAYFKYYGLISSDPIGNTYMASSTEFSNLSKFIEKTRELSLKPVYLLGKEGGEFSLVLSGGGEIYFDIKESLSKTSENLEALLQTPALTTISEKDTTLDYIDLRFGNKLYYKLK
jgi:hypothetical protein